MISRRWPTGEEDLHSEIQTLQAAIDLYRGDFLSGFSIGDSAPFEEWALLQGEALSRKMMALLQRLADLHAGRGDWEKAQAYVRHQLEIEPWNEDAHRQLMLALALGGQRSAALAHEACRQLLASELGRAGGETNPLRSYPRRPIRRSSLALSKSSAPGIPPYKGLQYFDEADGLFFGRVRAGVTIGEPAGF
jgi:DNA-binding SARP family transcriptional activator